MKLLLGNLLKSNEQVLIINVMLTQNRYLAPHRIDTWTCVHKAFQNRNHDQAQVRNSSTMEIL